MNARDSLVAEPLDADEIVAVLREIEANHRAWADAGRSRKRHLPFWLLRQQYRICKENEPLFARLGIEHPPFFFETARGLSWSITRRLIGV